MRDLLAEVLGLLGLGWSGVTLGSLRSGGARAVFLKTRNVPARRLQGRWSSERALEVYVQEAVCVLIVCDLEDSAPEVEVFRAFLPLLEIAPVYPWWTLFSRRVQLAAVLRHHRAKLKEKLLF